MASIRRADALLFEDELQAKLASRAQTGSGMKENPLLDTLIKALEFLNEHGTNNHEVSCLVQ